MDRCCPASPYVFCWLTIPAPVLAEQLFAAIRERVLDPEAVSRLLDRANLLSLTAPEMTVQLRLVVTKDTYTAQFRPDGKGEFKTVASGNLAPSAEEQISIQCYNGPTDAEHGLD